ncbi:invasion associated locus B family protein [Roseicyclus sp. F158]|uniref:Invasion associated locus B family protein n=1 Tax=Tropicimonas omnivorans TaxID=3075590 RepID=A0ABU3DJH2_9RHOB|nr:invasion associated locus B family protein [Roseicyclus sp. F158]MDT0683728.1 invasion associated locus B family protein [Roseicyclus sp. F158]
MNTTLSLLALAATLGFAGPVLAQDDGETAGTAADAEQGSETGNGEQTPAQAAAEALDMGEPVPGQAAPQPGPGGRSEPAASVEGAALGQTYILEASGDWEVHCVNTQLDADPCVLHQLLQDGAGNSVATIEIVSIPGGQQAVAGATIVTPLETLLTQQVTLSVDSGQARRYPFTFCVPAGCVSRVGFTEAEVNSFRRGAAANLRIVPASAPDQEVNLNVSLSGFTDGFSMVREANLANAAEIEELQAAQAEGAN